MRKIQTFEDKESVLDLPEKNRGTQDDFEIVRMVVCENRALLQRVLERLRESRKTDQGDMFEKVKSMNGGPRKKALWE